jgi:NTP pyrophosphatase (non-canonical NTP hydrolase)
VLVIDTNNLDFVLNEDDRGRVIERIKSSLQFGVYQTQLPGVEAASLLEPGEILNDLEARPHGLTDFQQFHLSLDAEKGFDSDLYFNFIGLNEEIGELARVLKLMWSRQSRYGMNGLSAREAFEKVLVQDRERIQDELADCLAYLLKLSNYAGIDLEQAYLRKMTINANRSWEDGQVVPEEG